MNKKNKKNKKTNNKKHIKKSLNNKIEKINKTSRIIIPNNIFKNLVNYNENLSINSRKTSKNENLLEHIIPILNQNNKKVIKNKNFESDSDSDSDFELENEEKKSSEHIKLISNENLKKKEYKKENNIIIMNENNDLKRKRRNSESDLYDYKIRERSKYDEYFRNQNKNNQIDILKKEDEIYNYFETDIPIRYKILYSNLPNATKLLILQKIDLFENTKPCDSEYNKMNKWLKGLSQIPFGNYINMPVSLNDGDVKIQKFLYDSYEILKKTIYGQLDAKNKIMQILAQWISNPFSTGQIIALEGPPGVGKTSLVRNGVSKALNRPFCFHALGGANDVSNLEGHSYTYEGAMWGRMVEMLMESKYMNPVIFFDELDKISDTNKGNEITGLLTHLTDYSQNSVFQDKYFIGIDIDFSKTMFFFSFNDIELINPILKDRLTIVKFKGYNVDEKIHIVQDFIIPDLLKNIGFKTNDIILNLEVIKYIINTYTENEEGVRNIKRCVEDLFLKINLLRLIQNKEKNTIDIDYKIDNLSFPLNITLEIVDNLLQKNIKNEKHVKFSI
jgi:ATP-dependent Lon protease